MSDIKIKPWMRRCQLLRNSHPVTLIGFTTVSSNTTSFPKAIIRHPEGNLEYVALNEIIMLNDCDTLLNINGERLK